MFLPPVGDVSPRSIHAPAPHTSAVARIVNEVGHQLLCRIGAFAKAVPQITVKA